MLLGQDLGRRLKGDWGTVGRFRQTLRWGTVHTSVPPIFREVVLGYWMRGKARTELKKGVMEESFF